MLQKISKKENPGMKKHFRQIFATVLALTMVLLCSFSVQAETITKKDQIITLYSSASQCYNAGRRAYAPSNETSINTDIYMNWGVTSFKSSNPSVVKLASRKCYPLYQANPETTLISRRSL